MEQQHPPPIQLIQFVKYFDFTIAISMLAACQPSDTRPGLWLSGEVVTQPVADWSFTNDVEEIFIETNPWYGMPHSTTIWCVVFEGTLYIGSYGGNKKFWENNLAEDAEARLGISRKLYEVATTAVADKELSANLDLTYNTKYDMAEVFGNEIPQWRFYKVEQRQ